jgi:murein DD-endopeptidase MepM/ murein hydrolase activator NlpD
MITSLTDLLKKHPDFSPVIVSKKPYRLLDFSGTNQNLLQADLSNTTVFTKYVFEEMVSNSSYNGIGGYGEQRVIYRKLEHFVRQEEEPRCVHLGVDIWAQAGEAIYAPLKGKVHSFAFNNNTGDYGPTIILEHEIDGTKFYTLYGHLSLNSITYLTIGKTFKPGEKIGEIGSYPTNGDWPPHLHFQIIADMGAYKGDFPGVCSISDRSFHLSACPDPNMILRFAELG